MEVSYLGGQLHEAATRSHTVLTDQPCSAGGADAALTQATSKPGNRPTTPRGSRTCGPGGGSAAGLKRSKHLEPDHQDATLQSVPGDGPAAKPTAIASTR